MKRETLGLLCACMVGFAFSANYTNHAPLTPALIAEFRFSLAMAGLLTTGIFLTHALMQIPGGHLADRLGSRPVLAAALAVVCIGNFAIGFATSYGQLLFWKIFVGLGTGTSFVAGARYLAHLMPALRLPMAQGYFGGSVLLGSGFVIFAVPRVTAAFNWHLAFFATASVATVVLLAWVIAAPRPSGHIHPQSTFLSMISHGQLWLLGLVQMASFGLVIVVGAWITTLLHERLGMTASQAGTAGSMVLLLGILTRPLGGALIARVSVRPLLVASMLMSAAGCFLLGSIASTLGLAVAAIVLLGIGCGMPYAALFNRAAALHPGRAGAAMGLVNMLGIVMILVGAPLVGRVADWTGSFESGFVALGAFTLVVGAISLGIRKQ